MGNIVDVPWEKPDIIRRFHRNVIETQLTYLLHAAVLLEKLTVSQLVQKSPAQYATRTVHYFIHTFPPPGSTLSKLNAVHDPIPLPEDPF